MGKGIKLPSPFKDMAAPIGAGNAPEIPRLQEEELTQVERLNDLILAGSDPDKAARLASRDPKNAEKLKKRLQSNLTIVERNRLMFEKVGMKKTEPYRVLMDIMMNADKTVPVTETNHEGKTYTTYAQAPDWTARLAAAKQVTLLMGLDPRAEMRVNIANMGNGQSVVQFDIAGSYLTICNMTNEAAQLAAYNEFQRNQKSGGYKITESTSIIEGDYTEGAPIGAGG